MYTKKPRCCAVFSLRDALPEEERGTPPLMFVVGDGVPDVPPARSAAIPSQ
jgi:hypothetical protein